jgi:hypothetical protein
MYVIVKIHFPDKTEALFLPWWVFDKMTDGPQDVKLLRST